MLSNSACYHGATTVQREPIIGAYLTRVKGHGGAGPLGDRIAMVRRVLGGARGPLSQPEFQQLLREHFGTAAPSLSTVKRWEQKTYGRISADDAGMVAELAGAAVDWVLKGKGRGPRLGESGGNAARTPESGAPRPSDTDLFEEIIRRPADFARRMETAAAKLGTSEVLAYLDDAESICRERGTPLTRFFASLRARLRAGGAAADRKGA